MLPAGNVIGHSEWAPTRKTDIGPYINTVRAKSGSPVNGEDDEMQAADWTKMEDLILRCLLAAQTGKGNTLISAAQAGWFQGNSNAKIYELLAYGDSRLESEKEEPHANSIQRVRFEMIQDRAQVAALAKVVGQLAEAQGNPIDMEALRLEIQKTVQDGLASLDLRITSVQDETESPASPTQ